MLLCRILLRSVPLDLSFISRQLTNAGCHAPAQKISSSRHPLKSVYKFSYVNLRKELTRVRG